MIYLLISDTIDNSASCVPDTIQYDITNCTS